MLRPLDADAPFDVGPYRLLAGLGSGGMGTVHLAVPHEGGLEDLVALKTVRRDLEPEGDFRIRFRREVEAARAVRSPYVSALVDADPSAERPWLATEYVAGPPLDETVTRQGPLPVSAVRDLGATLARGLAAVHGARLVHRDLKPANVVLGTTGPRLIDFGIAQAYDATALTATGIMVGSPGFMSPEHIAGNRSVTTASDVFCLGAVLCFAATGHGPFEDTELAAIVHRIAQGRADLSKVPEELKEVVAGCLRQDPDSRPTTGELIRALDPAAAAARPGVDPTPRPGPFPWPDGVQELIHAYETAVGRALLAPPVPPPPRTPPTPAPEDAAPAPKRAGNRRRWAIGIGSGLLAGSLAAVLLLTLPNGGTSPEAEAGAGAGSTADAATDQPKESPATARTAPVVHSGLSDFGPDALDRTLQPENWRPWTASFEAAGSATGCALSGAVLLCSLYDEEARSGRLEARNASDGERLWHYPAEAGTDYTVGSAGFALDDRHVYAPSADGAGIEVLDLKDGKPVTRLPGRGGYLPAAVRVHDGRIFVSYTGDGGTGQAANMLFRAYGAANRAQQWERVIPLAFPPSLGVAGDRVWLTGAAETLALDPATGKTLARVAEHCSRPGRDDPHVFCGQTLRDARTLKEVNDRAATGQLEAVSRDGLGFARGTGRRQGSPYLKAIDVRTGHEQWSLTWQPGDSVDVAGDRLVTFGSQGLRTYRLDSGELDATLTTIRGWPLQNGASAQPTTALISGGAFFLTFEDGTVVSASVP